MKLLKITLINSVCLFCLTSSVLWGKEAPSQVFELPNKLWKRGLAIAPVRLNLEGKDRKIVGLGSYIVNAQAGCVDCHTTPTFTTGGNPYLGQPESINQTNYLAGGAQFGPFTAPNLTPDPQTGLPAGLTFEQFRESMRTGKDFKNRHPEFGPILQVFPWPAYSKLTDTEIRAIYEYLRSVPPANPVEPNRTTED